MDELLKEIFKQDSSIGFVGGKRDSGKSDFSIRILEDGQTEGYWSKIGSNTATYNDPRLSYICYMDRLEDWLKLPRKKAFFLDELGKHLNRMRSMSTMSKMIMDVCQLIRKYDAHLIGAAPNAVFVNQLFFNTDILDYYMEKLSREKVFVKSYVSDRWVILEDIPRTSIKFKSKDIARFELEDPNRGRETFASLPPQKQAILLYGKLHTMRAVAREMGVSAMQVSRLIKKELEEQKLHVVTSNDISISQ